jgi:mRNA interferase MazF
MQSIRFGAVILVPFPFTDQTTSKPRPAVVVSSHAYNSQKGDLILMPITSQLHANAFAEVAVSDWRGANLLKPSAVKPVLATLEQSLVIRVLGTLVSRDAGALRQALQLMIG